MNTVFYVGVVLLALCFVSGVCVVDEVRSYTTMLPMCLLHLRNVIKTNKATDENH